MSSLWCYRSHNHNLIIAGVVREGFGNFDHPGILSLLGHRTMHWHPVFPTPSKEAAMVWNRYSELFISSRVS